MYIRPPFRRRGVELHHKLKEIFLWVRVRCIRPFTNWNTQAGLRAEWSVNEANRRVKFYSITKEGRKRLQQEASDWKRLSSAITSIVFES